MDKSAIFVDAGYLLARGGLVVCGTQRRAEVRGTKSVHTSQSHDLVREADEHLTIGPELPQKFFSVPEQTAGSANVVQEQAVEVGASLGGRWAEKATQSEIQAVLEQTSIPRAIDAQLLRDASRGLAVPRIPDELVNDLRAAFRASLERAVAKEAALA
jgi:hypothetical protein